MNVHSGHSCAEPDLVGGQFFSDHAMDPWLTAKWTSDDDGVAVGSITVPGVTVSDVLGRTVVVHASADGPDAGAEISCGVISDSDSTRGESPTKELGFCVTAEGHDVNHRV